ncbi:glutamine synthetase [Xylariaceae sp. FL1272]|nr:glutamine synthetase [Xylariaceae sp. FL1272]
MPFPCEGPGNLQKLDAFLKDHQSVKIIRLRWFDYSKVLRTRFVPTRRCLQVAAASDHIHIAQNSMLIPISTAPRIFSMADHHETHVTVMSYMNQDESKTMFDKCPRALFVDTLREVESAWAARLIIGFEIEFVLLGESNNIITPVDRLDGYSRTAGLRAETLDLVEASVDALEKSSIEVHHFHAEAYDQLEISLAAEHALEALDSLVLAQETIRAICVRRKLKATMAPKATLTGLSLCHGQSRFFASALLLAAHDGTENDIDMIWKDCKLFPDLLDADAGASYGLNKSMPVSFKEALDCFRSDTELGKGIPNELLNWFLSVKDKEAEEFAKMSGEERRLRFLR